MNSQRWSTGMLVGAAVLCGSLMASGDALAKHGNGKKAKAETYRYARSNDDRDHSRPPGWDRGNKNGWRGRDLPPGQAKRHDDRNDRDRDRYDRDRYGRNDRDRYGDRLGSRRDRDRYSNRTYTGRITDDAGTFSRSITVSERGVNHRFSVGKDAAIYRRGRRISVHELRRGDIVRVTSLRERDGDERLLRVDVIG